MSTFSLVRVMSMSIRIICKSNSNPNAVGNKNIYDDCGYQKVIKQQECVYKCKLSIHLVIIQIVRIILYINSKYIEKADYRITVSTPY
jgi:hypothetical protein